VDIRKPSKKRSIVIACLLLAAIAIAVLVIFLTVGKPLIAFVSEPEQFRTWVGERGLFGKLFYVGAMFLQVVVAVLPGEPFEIAGGYAFGAVEGSILCLLGAVLGSTVVFWLVRTLGKRLVTLFFSEEKLASVEFLKTSPRRNELFFIVFLIPGTPKDLLCYFAGLTDMKFGVWMLISTVGRLPSLLTSTIGGDVLGDRNYLFAAILFAGTLIISLIGILLFRKIRGMHEKRIASHPHADQ
jgi:uncharacterized membrane protein YdjX (TVP38/TMEM64 family)